MEMRRRGAEDGKITYGGDTDILLSRCSKYCCIYLYGTDKAKAMHHQWRIKEAVLIGIAFVGGAFGAFAG